MNALLCSALQNKNDCCCLPGEGPNFTVRFINILIYAIARVYLILIFVKVQKVFFHQNRNSLTIFFGFGSFRVDVVVFLLLFWKNVHDWTVCRHKCAILNRKRRKKIAAEVIEMHFQTHRSSFIKDDVPICKCAGVFLLLLLLLLLSFEYVIKHGSLINTFCHLWRNDDDERHVYVSVYCHLQMPLFCVNAMFGWCLCVAVLTVTLFDSVKIFQLIYWISHIMSISFNTVLCGPRCEAYTAHCIPKKENTKLTKITYVDDVRFTHITQNHYCLRFVSIRFESIRLLALTAITCVICTGMVRVCAQSQASKHTAHNNVYCGKLVSLPKHAHINKITSKKPMHIHWFSIESLCVCVLTYAHAHSTYRHFSLEECAQITFHFDSHLVNSITWTNKKSPMAKRANKTNNNNDTRNSSNTALVLKIEEWWRKKQHPKQNEKTKSSKIKNIFELLAMWDGEVTTSKNATRTCKNLISHNPIAMNLWRSKHTHTRTHSDHFAFRT